MDSLITLAENYADALVRESQANEDAVAAASEDVLLTRHALELRLAELAGFASGLQYAGVPAPHVADRINTLIVGQS